MATFTDYKISKYDDFNTPEYVWDWVLPYIPRDKVVWEAFYSNGDSGAYLESKGVNVIHQDVDFFSNNLGDIVVSNPPFQYKKQIIERLVLLDKPFILIVPVSTISYQYTRKLKEIQILIPPQRMKFKKVNKETGEVYENWKKHSSAFDSIFLCWKMNLPKDIIFMS